MTNNAKRPVILLSVLIVLAAAALVCWASFRPDALKPVSDITINIAHSGGQTVSYQIASTAGTLYEAQQELGLIECVLAQDSEGEPEEDGEAPAEADPELFVTAVDGETADASQGQYWLWDRNGSRSYADIDKVLIADGDVFDFYIYTAY